MLVGRFHIPEQDPENKVKDRGDGICVHLDTATLLCKIYEKRPKICRVKESAPPWMPLWLSYSLTWILCKIARFFFTQNNPIYSTIK